MPKKMATNLAIVPGTELWKLDIIELTGHNVEAQGREEVNALLKKGWVVLHLYTLRYQDDNIWRERPMTILGRPRKKQQR